MNVRLVDLARQFAMVHISDSDELGQMANELLRLINDQLAEPLYDRFLNKLKDIREFEWGDNRSLLLWGENEKQPGARENETVLEAIARHMVNVIQEEKS